MLFIETNSNIMIHTVILLLFEGSSHDIDTI